MINLAYHVLVRHLDFFMMTTRVPDGDSLMTEEMEIGAEEDEQMLGLQTSQP